MPQGEAKAAFEKEAFAAVCRHELMQKEIEHLYALFEEAEIPYIPLKGSILRGYYPSPWMRNSCDIDILVRPEDHGRAKELLLSRGYHFFVENAINAAFDAPSGIHFELHYRLVKENVLPVAAKLLNNAWEYAHPASDEGFRYELSNPVFYLYHIAHMAKHYLHGGCGIRPYLDLWILTKRVSHDPTARMALLEECGLASFALAAENLTNAWFGEEEKTQIAKEMEAFVLAGGVYGTVKNHISVQQAKRGGKVRYALSRIFISYDTLKYSYPVLKKHKWLYPFCQVRRWFRLVFLGGFKRSVRSLSLNQSIDAGARNETSAHLKELGF